MSEDPAHAACLDTWLVDAPQSHPYWPWHLISIIHLRDLPGVPSAQKAYPNAEYELMIYAIDSSVCPSPDPDDEKTGYPLLNPPDVVEQFHVNGSDHDARRICEACVTAIVQGFLSPDQDWRSVWKDTLAKTAEHYRSGAHVEN